MILRDIVQRKGDVVHTVVSHASCDRVVEAMVRYNIGSLLVQDEPELRPLGIITERDILRAQAHHRLALHQMRVMNVMSRELITASPRDSVLLAMHLMTDHRIRHLPIIENNMLYGIVSIGDIVKAHHDELARENHCLRCYIQDAAATLAILQ